MTTNLLAPADRATGTGDRLIERFMPWSDVAEKHETIVRAPAAVVFAVARDFDMQSLPLVRALFRIRARLMGAAQPTAQRVPRGLIAETTALGWGILAERPGRELVMGAATQPWRGDVAFTAVAPERFARFDAPDRVKIVWTIEAEPHGVRLTRFRTETRVLATDPGARREFARYWRWARFGIVLIRWLLLPAVRREAERRAAA